MKFNWSDVVFGELSIFFVRNYRLVLRGIRENSFKFRNLVASRRKPCPFSLFFFNYRAESWPYCIIDKTRSRLTIVGVVCSYGRRIHLRTLTLLTRNRNDCPAEAWNWSLIACHFGDRARRGSQKCRPLVSIKSPLRKVKVYSPRDPGLRRDRAHAHPLHQRERETSRWTNHAHSRTCAQLRTCRLELVFCRDREADLCYFRATTHNCSRSRDPGEKKTPLKHRRAVVRDAK